MFLAPSNRGKAKCTNPDRDQEHTFLPVRILTVLRPIKNSSMKEKIQKGASSNPIYGLGIIGAAVYFISQATSFWMGVLGFLKAIVWPALLVYEAFTSLYV